MGARQDQRRTLFIAIAALALGSCSDNSEQQLDKRPADTLVRLADDEAKGVDPQIYADLATARIAAEQFEGLTRLDAAGQPEAGLAKSWQVSADGLVWTFQMRANARFSDATPIRATLFVDVFERLRDPAMASPHLGIFAALDTIIASKENAVVIRLRHPFPALPELLAHPALAALPLHRKNWANERPVVASGAYQLIDWKLSDHILLSANPHWHGGQPATPKVMWRTVSDSLTAFRTFMGQEADTTADFPSSRLKELRRVMPEQVRVSPYRGTYYFAFNTRKPPFADVRVRRALSMVVDRSWISNALVATGVSPAETLVPPSLLNSTPTGPFWQNWPTQRRVGEAGKLLKQAGYGPNRPLRFSIRFNSDVDHRRIAVALAAMWKPLNVEVDLLNSEASLHFASLKRADFDLARSGWIGDYSAPETFLNVHTRQAGPANYSGYANPAYEDALAMATKTAGVEDRKRAMRWAESLLLNDAPVLILWHYVSKSLVSTRVKGWQDNVANVHPSRILSLEP